MMSLPEGLLLRRLERELELCSRLSEVTLEPGKVAAPVTFPLTFLVRVSGRFPQNEISEHHFQITVSRDYPFQKPEVRWLTPIFHPNIAPPEEGGIVCVNLINQWRAERTLCALISGIMNLLSHPNAEEPLGYSTCISASEKLLER